MIFTCTQCGQRITVGDELAGGQAQCPFCYAVTGVPPAPIAQGVPMAAPADPLDAAAAQDHNTYAPPPPTNQAGTYYSPLGPSQQGYAIAGFVLSLLLPPLGLIFSWVALSKMKTYGNDEGKGLAVAGMVVSLVICSIWFLFFGGACCLGGARGARFF